MSEPTTREKIIWERSDFFREKLRAKRLGIPFPKTIKEWKKQKQ